jgi:hypothetical protein
MKIARIQLPLVIDILTTIELRIKDFNELVFI